MRPPTDGAGTTLCAGYNESYAIRQLIYRQLMNTNSSKLPGASTNDPKTVTLTIIYDKVLTINLRTTANSQIQQLHQRQQHHLPSGSIYTVSGSWSRGRDNVMTVDDVMVLRC